MRTVWHDPKGENDLMFVYSNDINVQHPRDGEVFTVEMRGRAPVSFVNIPGSLLDEIFVNIKTHEYRPGTTKAIGA